MVSKHHYAQHLAAMGNKVFFLAPRIEEDIDIPFGIKILTPPKLPKGMRYFPKFWRLIQHKNIGKKLQAEAGVHFDILWTFDTSWLFDLKELTPKAIRILHLVDLSMNFEWKIAAESADLCLGSSSRIQQKLASVNSNSHFIHHGFSTYPIVSELLTSDRKKIVYAGNLTISYLDHARLLALVKGYPDCEFHFIGDRGNANLSNGRVSQFLEELGQFENVRLHNPVTPELLASYYAAADVLLLCYNPIYRQQISNPHKVMEYLGSGKPILSTWLEEYENQTELIFMSDDLKEYVDGLKGLLEMDDRELSDKRKAFAKSNSYLKQLERVEQMINSIK